MAKQLTEQQLNKIQAKRDGEFKQMIGEYHHTTNKAFITRKLNEYKNSSPDERRKRRFEIVNFVNPSPEPEPARGGGLPPEPRKQQIFYYKTAGGTVKRVDFTGKNMPQWLVDSVQSGEYNKWSDSYRSRMVKTALKHPDWDRARARGH